MSGTARACYEASRFAAHLGNWLDPDDPDTTGRPREGGAKATSMAHFGKCQAHFEHPRR